MCLDADIQRLADEAAVRDVHLRYCRGIDRRDWDLVRSCYQPGAIENHGPYNGGFEGFVDVAKEALETCESTSHFTGNQLVEVDGDIAWHEAYCRAYQRLRPTEAARETDWVVNFRCFDRMERRDGRWGIAKRTVIVDTERRDPVLAPDADGPAWHFGRADSRDLSYEREVAT
jgi:hypothetical protein